MLTRVHITVRIHHRHHHHVHIVQNMRVVRAIVDELLENVERRMMGEPFAGMHTGLHENDAPLTGRRRRRRLSVLLVTGEALRNGDAMQRTSLVRVANELGANQIGLQLLQLGDVGVDFVQRPEVIEVGGVASSSVVLRPYRWPVSGSVVGGV